MLDNHHPARFLIIDDDEVCIMAIQRAMKKLKIVNPVRTAADGVEGLEILRADRESEGLLPPYIVTLDLSMPKMGGLEFLKHVREDPKLQKLVIFVLTTSDDPADVNDAYLNNVAGYIIKEDAENSFIDALSVIDEYAQLVVLPK